MIPFQNIQSVDKFRILSRAVYEPSANPLNNGVPPSKPQPVLTAPLSWPSSTLYSSAPSDERFPFTLSIPFSLYGSRVGGHHILYKLLRPTISVELNCELLMMEFLYMVIGVRNVSSSVFECGCMVFTTRCLLFALLHGCHGQYQSCKGMYWFCIRVNT